MAQLRLDGMIYDSVGTIHFYDTDHIVIANDNEVKYVNKIKMGSLVKYCKPTNDLRIESNPNKSLDHLRKQYFIKRFISFINSNKVYDCDELQRMIDFFNKYIRDTYISTFISWPMLSDNEFYKSIKPLLDDLESKLDKELNYKETAKDNTTFLINEEASIVQKVENNLVSDPSSRGNI